MKNFFSVLVVILFIQFCTSTTVEHAENELRDLKGVIARTIDEALHAHSKMSQEIEEAIQNTKKRALEDIEKKTGNYQARLKSDRTLTYKCSGSRTQNYEQLKIEHSDDLIRCVEQQGRDSLNALSTQRLALTEKIYNEVFEEERRVVACGRKVECLDSVISAVKGKIFRLTKEIRDNLELSRHDKNQQLNVIRGCAVKSVAEAEQALANVPSCTY